MVLGVLVCCLPGGFGRAGAVSGRPAEAVRSLAEAHPDWTAAPAPPARTRPGADGTKARSFFYLEGEPGTVLHDSLALTNKGDEPRTFRLRGADAYNAGGGRFAVRKEGDSRGAGAWTALARKTVEVPPRTRAEVPLSVTVPDSAVPGDHPAALVVDDGERKVGVRMYLRVSGPTLAALSVEDVTVRDAGDGAATIGYTLVNRGNVVLRPRLAVHADGLFGPLVRQPARALPVELLPGRRVTRHERWPRPPAVDVADVRLTVTAEAGAHDAATASYTAVPWKWTLGVLLVLAGGGVAWYVRRRRRAPAADAGPRQPRTRRPVPTAGAAK
ncbi:hypothetical protein HC362_20045 [Streptomyces sp. 891-h]|nr:hypothetical protein HC362_20045 [Streptomyces sp. 891-h]